MGSDPPLSVHHHHSPSPPGRAASAHSLPSVAQLLAEPSPSSQPTPADHLAGPRGDPVRQPPPLDPPASRFPPPSQLGAIATANSSHARQTPSAWTAINQQSPGSRPVADPPDRARTSPTAPDDHHFYRQPARQSPKAAPHSAFTFQVAQNLQREPAAPQSPISAKRQDSAVSDSIQIRPPTETHLSPNRLEFASSYFPSFPSKYFSHQSTVSGSNSYLASPLSPAPSPVPNFTMEASHSAQPATQSTRHDRDPGSSHLERPEGHRSDRRHDPAASTSPPTNGLHDYHTPGRPEPSNPVSSELNNTEPSTTNSSVRSPHHPRDSPARLMPPPQSPPAVMPQALATRPLNTGHTSECSGSQVTASGSTEPSQTAHAAPPLSSYPGQRDHQQTYSGDAGTATGSGRSDSKCEVCGEVWRIPPWPGYTSGPSQNRDDLAERSGSLAMLIREYGVSIGDDFEVWKSKHRNCVPPDDHSNVATNSAATTTLTNGLTQNGKRKYEDPPNDSHVSSKQRRATSNSESPTLCQTTPPPEEAASSPADGARFPDGLPRFKYNGPGAVEAYVTEGVARVLGHPGVPSRNEHPPQDSRNMWHEVKHEGSRSAGASPAAEKASPRSSEQKSKGGEERPEPKKE